MKKILFITFILLIGLVGAATFTPQGDIDLVKLYAIHNATNISAEYYCNSTSCYEISDFLTTATGYASGSNLTLVGNVFALDTIGVLGWLDNVYLKISDAFSGVYSDLTGKPILLSNFTDDLGNRGYTNNLNFTNGANYYNSTNPQTETDPLWTANQSSYYTGTQTDVLLASQDSCSEITGCVINAITDGNTNWDNSYGFWNDTFATFNKTYADILYRENSWDNFTGIPTATPTNGDTTHLSTADHIYDWVIGLGYATDSKVDSLGNWSNDKGSYYTSSQVDSGFATIDEPLWASNSSTVARVGDCPSGQFIQNTTTGGVECAAPTGSGDITGVIAGTGLLGGGLSGDVTINLSADICGSGNVSKYNGTHFNCVADQGSAYTSGSNLTLATNEFSLDTTAVLNWLNNVYSTITYVDNIISSIGNWSNDKGDYSTTTEANLLYRAETWDNFTGIPTATPSNGDITHLSTADQIYDWIIGLGYSTESGTVTSISAGDGMDFTTITSLGPIVMGTPGTIGGSTSNGITTTSHTHEITSDDTGDCAAGVLCGGGHTHTEYIQSLIEDTSPELGGYLDTAGQNIGSTTDEIENIYVSTNSRIYFGDGQEANMYYNGTALIIAG